MQFTVLTRWTVFNSPLPNPKLWNGPTIGFLQTQDTFATGGWWHDSRILAATGEGLEKEEPRAWQGWWNERIVELIELSVRQKDALTILLTGRSEAGFAELIKKMLASKGLDVDMVVLKPAAGPSNQKFSSTMNFKQAFLETLVETYAGAEEIRIYEDRVRHVKAFRDFFTDYNKRQISMGPSSSRGSIIAEVIQVADGATLLDPVIEVAEVQRLINDHNAAASTQSGRRMERLQIKKTVFYTGYLINNTDTQRLLTLAQLPSNLPDSEVKFLANNVLITPRPCPESILQKVGGMGSKTTWEVTGTAVFENKIWAARVQPIPGNKKIYTENPTPVVVLALRKGARPIDAARIQNWQPVLPEKAFVFETTVGEKVVLRIEAEDLQENEYESLFPNKSFKRKHPGDDENRPPPSSGHHNHNSHHRTNQSNNFNGRGGRGNHRGNNSQRGGGYRNNNNNRGGNGGGGGGGGGGGKGKGRGYNYRSLDDVGDRNSMAAPPIYNPAVAYEDFPPLQKNSLTPQQQVQQQFEQYQAQLQKHNNGNGGNGGGKNNGELQYF